MNKKVFNIVGWVLAVAVIAVVIWAIAHDKDGGKKKRQQDESIEEVVEAEGVRAGEMQAFSEGEFTYRFEGIAWTIEAEDEARVSIPVTSLAWTFENFSRRDNGIFVKFNKPFKLGSVQGICSEVVMLDYDTNSESGIPLSFVQCAHVQNEETWMSEYGVFQEGKNIVVKNRSGQELKKKTPFVTLTSKDMTQIVE
jgi:hypothetical protein